MVYICNLNATKIKMLHKLMEYRTHICKHNTVLLLYILVYTLVPGTLWITYKNVCSVQTEIYNMQADKNLKIHWYNILHLSETWLQNTDDIQTYTRFNNNLHWYAAKECVIYSTSWLTDVSTKEHMDHWKTKISRNKIWSNQSTYVESWHSIYSKRHLQITLNGITRNPLETESDYKT